jgi:ABC-2 type transport system permease protein
VSRWQKTATVASFEFLATVKRPGYLMATFGMPLFMAAYAGVVAVPAYFAEKEDRQPAVHGVVDRAGVLRLSGDVAGSRGSQGPDEMERALEAAGQGRALQRPMASRFIFRPFASELDARAALAERRIKGFFVLPREYLTEGTVEAYSPDSFAISGGDLRNAFATLLRARLVAERLEPALSARILQPMEHTRRFAVTRTGEIRDGGTAAAGVRLAVPLLFMVLFLVSILMSSGYLLQGTATEKENKVVEVLLASADPDEILAGKLVGLGGAGLLQIAVWLTMVLVTSLGVIPLLLSAPAEVPWLALALAIPFFIVGFLFFGSLMLGTGSLGSNMREAQQLAMVWSLTAAVPVLLIAALMRNPSGAIARVLTWLPFSSGPVIVLRASTDAGSLAWWEIVGAFVLLLLATWVAVRLGARLFRIGMLSAGARPGFREVLRQARLAS